MLKKSILSFLSCMFFLNGGFAQHDPQFWGTASYGGTTNAGTIFKYSPSTSVFEKVHDFHSYQGGFPEYTTPISGSDGMLYGLTAHNGDKGNGVIFRFDPLTEKYTVLYHYGNYILGDKEGGVPLGSLIQATNGKLYGMTSEGGDFDKGTLFEYDLTKSSYKKIFSFDGVNGSTPTGDLLQASNGLLYGMTNKGGSANLGVLFQLDLNTGTYTKLMDFDGAAKGQYPYGSLTQGSNGIVYGMTYQGGTSNMGVLFQYNTITNTYLKKIDFEMSLGGYPFGKLVPQNNGKFYGLTSYGGTVVNARGTLFEYDALSNTCVPLHNFLTPTGGSPYSFVTLVNNKLYGTTMAGGSYKDGVIFEYDPGTHAYYSIYHFDGTKEGGILKGGLCLSNNGLMYGMTSGGTPFANAGTFFKIDPVAKMVTELFEFNNDINGTHPYSGLVQIDNGNIYGTTYNGGANNYGTLYQFIPSLNDIKKIIDFTIEGAGPRELLKSSNGKLYGTGGSPSGFGQIFEFDPLTEKIKSIAYFDNNNTGFLPGSRLIEALNGKIYGTTFYGTSNDKGVLFEFDPATNVLSPKVVFDKTIGANPNGVIQASDGKLYGTTQLGGANDIGVLFSYDYTTGIYKKEFDFDGSNSGAKPGTAPIEYEKGRLAGTTLNGGTYNDGTLFEFNIVSKSVVKRVDFDSINGQYATSELMKASNGKLYGNTFLGGKSGSGVMFEYNPVDSTFKKLVDFDTSKGESPAYSQVLELSNVFPAIASQPSLVNGCINSQNYFTLEIADGDNDSLQFITTSDDTALISNSSLSVIHTTGNVYHVSYKPQFNKTGTANIQLIVKDGYGGTIKTFVPVKINGLPNVILNPSGALSFCPGDSVPLKVSVDPLCTYTWFRNDTLIVGANDSVLWLKKTGTYYVKAASACGLGTSSPVTAKEKLCSIVWPGDTNNDSIVDNTDLLPVGLYYSKHGAPRAIISNNWNGYASNHWGENQNNGKDINYVDCNGDGIIDMNDTLAIHLNFTRVHSFNPIKNVTPKPQMIPELHIVTPAQPYRPGDWVDAELWIGSASVAVNALYGLSFNIQYNASLVTSGTEKIVYPNSWLCVPGTDAITLSVIEPVVNTAFGAETRIDHINVQGSGKIASFRFQLKDQITSETTMMLSFSGYKAVDASGLPVDFITKTDSIHIVPLISGIPLISDHLSILISPNPVSSQAIVSFNKNIEMTSLQLMDVMGRKVREISFSGTQLTFDKNELIPGVYFLNVYVSDKLTAHQKLIIQ